MRGMLLLSIIPILQVERLGHKEILQIILVLSDSAAIQTSRAQANHHGIWPLIRA